MSSISRTELVQAFDGLLQPERFKDYGPNGLQVEGKPEIARIVSGVTASRALIEAAIAARADAIFVHHGLFWRGQDGRVTGWMKQRLQLLLAHDINLLAYHLPLDAHAELGNNAQLGRVLGWTADARFGEQDLGFAGPADFAGGQALADHVARALGRTVTWVGPQGAAATRPIRRVARSCCWLARPSPVRRRWRTPRRCCVRNWCTARPVRPPPPLPRPPGWIARRFMPWRWT